MPRNADLSSTDSPKIIVISHLNKWFGEFHVLKDINLAVDKGEKLVICGPSGSGKSTLIRCINRLEKHQQGQIIVDGIELTNDVKHIDQVRREVGMLFQNFNLFPHMTVLENLTLSPVWIRKMPLKEARELAFHYLERVKIPELADKYPGQCSGGAAAASGDCALPVHEPQSDAFRRAYIGPRPRDDQGGSGRDDRSGQFGDDHAVRDP